jgi:hypothetical protein
MLAKRCFVIKESPQPVAGCRNGINRSGELTVGFGDNPKLAWRTVLKVLGLGEDGHPIRAAPIQVATRQSVEPQRAAPLEVATDADMRELLKDIRARKASPRASSSSGSLPKKARTAASTTEVEREPALDRPIAPDPGDEADVRPTSMFALLRRVWLHGYSYSDMATWDSEFSYSDNALRVIADEVPTGRPCDRRTEFVFTGNLYCSVPAARVRRMRVAQRKNREIAEVLGMEKPEALLELQPSPSEILTQSNPDARLYKRNRLCQQALTYLSVSYYLRQVLAQWQENARTAFVMRAAAEEARIK